MELYQAIHDAIAETVTDETSTFEVLGALEQVKFDLLIANAEDDGEGDGVAGGAEA